MAAPKGNQFWKQRSKHGRDKLFATPELLWEAACEYFAWCDNHPKYEQELIKSGDLAGKIVKVPIDRPYSITGFQFYIRVSESFWRNFKSAGHEDFSAVINDIEKVIETQQFEGATVGIFNANIIARKLNLTDKQEIVTVSDPSKNVHKVVFENYSGEE